ncbi:hypothetical protein HMI51_33920 [Corallococcus coralloides]|nr:hypothetical protein [Corallococcus coralloides]
MQRERWANHEKVISRGDAFELISRAREALCDRVALEELMDDSQASSAEEAIRLTGCDICDHCRWEDDGTVSDTAHSSVNVEFGRVAVVLRGAPVNLVRIDEFVEGSEPDRVYLTEVAKRMDAPWGHVRDEPPSPGKLIWPSGLRAAGAEPTSGKRSGGPVVSGVDCVNALRSDQAVVVGKSELRQAARELGYSEILQPYLLGARPDIESRTGAEPVGRHGSLLLMRSGIFSMRDSGRTPVEIGVEAVARDECV